MVQVVFDAKGQGLGLALFWVIVVVVVVVVVVGPTLFHITFCQFDTPFCQLTRHFFLKNSTFFPQKPPSAVKVKYNRFFPQIALFSSNIITFFPHSEHFT